MLLAQDLYEMEGSYRATGQHVMYEFFTRPNVGTPSSGANGSTSMVIQDSYGIEIVQEVLNIPYGYNFANNEVGPIGLAEMDALQYYLYVTFDAEGGGLIENSQVLSSQTEGCVSDVVLQQLDDELQYSSNFGADVIVQDIMVSGQPTISPYAGQSAGTWSVTSSSFFSLFPITPTILNAEQMIYDDAFAVCYGTCVATGNGGTLTPGSDEAHAVCGGQVCAMDLLGMPGMIPYPGTTAGYVIENPETSFAPSNNLLGTVGDLHIEWHYIDGTVGETGLGDDVDIDEDEDGTPFDFILGYPALESTAMKASCDAVVGVDGSGAPIVVPMTFNFPVLGDVRDVLPALGMGDCIDMTAGTAEDPGLVDATSFYVMGTDYATWGGFLTWNAIAYAASGDASFAVNDAMSDASQADFVQTPDGDWFNAGGGGRMVMMFEPTCIPTMQAISVLGELTNVGEQCGQGDVNVDGAVNVLDIIATVAVIIDPTQNYIECGDLNGDINVNVLDIIIMVENVLGGGNRVGTDATNVKFSKTDEGMTMSADGNVDAIQMTISHGSDFSLDLTDKALVAEYHTSGSTTTFMVVNPGEDFVFSSTGNYEIEEMIAAVDDQYINAEINAPTAISLSAAYPNPFNPSTSFDLNVGDAGNISVMVYNVNGQLVDVLYDGYKDAGVYNMTINGQSLASGMYIVKANSADMTVSQKVMLIK